MSSKNAAKILLKFNVADQVVQIVVCPYDFSELKWCMCHHSNDYEQLQQGKL